MLSSIKYKFVINYKKRFPSAEFEEIRFAFPGIDEKIIKELLELETT